MRCYANLKTKFKTISVIKFNNSEIIDRLRRIISEKLSRLIPGDYILADAPYYHNIGDILIWQGIHDFCKTLQDVILALTILLHLISQKFPLRQQLSLPEEVISVTCGEDFKISGLK